MSLRRIAFTLFFLASPALAGEPTPLVPGLATPHVGFGDPGACPSALPPDDGAVRSDSGFLTGNHNFPNFINFVSNPLLSIDPRAVTAVYPIFGSVWFSNSSPIPDGDAQVYGPAISIALTDRLAVGVNQGGLVDIHAHANPGDRLRILKDELRESSLSARVAARTDTIDFSGDRFGFVNLGGFAQYTLVEDVPNQFLFTVGLRWEAPAGSYEVFQGHGPLELAPYFTAGKELGEWHVLLTGGYQFPAGPGNDRLNLFYTNVHLDRRCFGWLYPLVEFNCIYQERSVDFGLATRRGFVDFGTFEGTGNIVTLAAGANAVIVPEHLEFGAAYTTAIASQRDFDFNGIIVKMTFRY